MIKSLSSPPSFIAHGTEVYSPLFNRTERRNGTIWINFIILNIYYFANNNHVYIHVLLLCICWYNNILTFMRWASTSISTISRINNSFIAMIPSNFDSACTFFTAILSNLFFLDIFFHDLYLIYTQDF